MGVGCKSNCERNKCELVLATNLFSMLCDDIMHFLFGQVGILTKGFSYVCDSILLSRSCYVKPVRYISYMHTVRLKI